MPTHKNHIIIFFTITSVKKVKVLEAYVATVQTLTERPVLTWKLSHKSEYSEEAKTSYTVTIISVEM